MGNLIDSVNLALMFWIGTAQRTGPFGASEQRGRAFFKGQETFDVAIVNLTEKQKAIDGDRDLITARKHLLPLVKLGTPIPPHRIEFRLTSPRRKSPQGP